MTHERPLSPHLQVYKPQITSVLSILHRITGVVLCLGLFVLGWWLLAAASGPEAYATFQSVAGSPIGIIALVGWSFALFYHLCSGVRHLLMDTGLFFSIPEVYKSGYATLAAAALITAMFWIAYL
ncbi:MAG: succinate dehydrogenase, cytochrome b556 subunit [Proteobacteria bacterium]|nr:succinate dehydrogenase, cytochrome b556 subunit [Pseudomonadota bacterium]